MEIIIRELILDQLNEIVNSITQIHGLGEVNEVFVVKTNKQKIVIRLNNKDVLNQFKKGVWCIEQVQFLNIDTSPVIQFGIFKEYAYVILKFLDGINGKEYYNSKYIWNDFGGKLNKIHQISTKGWGDNMIEPGSFEGSWKDFLNYNISSLNDEDTLLNNVISKDQSSKLKERFLTLADKKFIFGLNHGDVSLKNSIINSENQVFLIDWDSSESHIVPHFDFACIISYCFNYNFENEDFKHLIQGYGMLDIEFESIKHDIISIILLTSIDKLRWAIDRKPEKIQEHSKRLISVVKRFL